MLSFFAVKPLFVQGFFPMHDDTQVARVFEMGKALKDGVFPVRWVKDLGYGYGYPIFNFYAPLSYYAGGFFSLLGFDALLATKIMMGLGIALAGVFMYVFAREFWGDLGGVVSGLLYLYIPYHALDIYVRGDVAEYWAYAFIPLVFFGLHKVFSTSNSNKRAYAQSFKWIGLGALGYCGVILSHNLTAMMVTPFVVAVALFYGFVSNKNKKVFTLYSLSCTLLLGLLLSAFYWIPALFEMRYTNALSQVGGGANFRDHFVCINQFWDSPWGFGGSIPGCIDGLSFKIGKLHLLLGFLAVGLSALLLFRKKILMSFKEINDYDMEFAAIALSFFGFIVSVFLMLEISRSIWEAIPPMAFFQYPWRFLILVSFFLSFLAGSLFWLMQIIGNKSKYLITARYVISAAVILALVIFAGRLFQPQTMYAKKSSDYTSTKALQWTASRISDEYMPENFAKPESIMDLPGSKFSIVNGIAKIRTFWAKTQRATAVVDARNNTVLRIALADFPAWRVFVDQREKSFSVTNRGIIISMSSGLHTVDVRFEQTILEKIANLLSLAGVAVLIIAIIYVRKKSNR